MFIHLVLYIVCACKHTPEINSCMTPIIHTNGHHACTQLYGGVDWEKLADT